MKAIVYANYGAPSVLQLQELEAPSPKDHEVLIDICATAVNSGDCRLRKADPFAVRFFFGLFRPKIKVLGGVFSGKVAGVGKKVTRFKVGDEVFGCTDLRFGAYAEQRCLPESASMVLKPQGLSHQEAAVIPFGATTALHFIKKANIQKGQKVLIYGASGAVGTAALQMAKAQGALVTAVCSGANAGMVKSLGADHVIDYTREDVASHGAAYDVVMDTVNKMPVSKALGMLRPKGTLILSASGMAEMLRGAWASMTSGKKVLMGVIAHTAEDMGYIQSLVEAGQLKPVIDKTFPLAQMAEAHAYVDGGHKKGNVGVVVRNG